MPSFSSLYALSFPFREEDSGMPDDVKVAMAGGEEVEICGDTACGALGSEIKGNETRKDCNALTGPARAEVRGVFFCQRGRSSEAEEESSSTLDRSPYSWVAISYLLLRKGQTNRSRRCAVSIYCCRHFWQNPANTQIQGSAQQALLRDFS
jgi:hypothetical protein